MVFNISAAAECGTYYGSEGFLLTDWGDGGHPQFPAVSLFSYVFGAACSWHCVSPHTEEAYAQRQKLISCCEGYLDRYVFCSGKKKSMSRLINAAGKYYLLEERLVFNGTLLNDEFLKTLEGKQPDMDIQSLRRIERYMYSIIDELSGFEGNTYADEAILNCRMTAVFSKGLIYLQDGGNSQDITAELEMISKEFEKLWLRKNKRPGMEIFIHKVKKFKELMK